MAVDPVHIRTVPNDHSFYLPLDIRSKEIRIFLLEPGRKDTPISGSLCYSSLALLKRGFLDFECLSYCWGDIATPKTIRLNFYSRLSRFQFDATLSNRKVSSVDSPGILAKLEWGVTSNLEAALRALRREQETRIIWIDAICIDQSNVIERSHQVALMTEIFEGARQVTAWIGRGDEMTDRAVQVALSLADRFSQDFDLPIDTSTSLERLALLIPTFWAFLMDSSEPVISDHDKASAALGHFFNLPWFRRIWVIQEIARASRAAVLYGDYIVPWPKIILAGMWLKVENSKLGTMREDMSNTLPLIWISLAGYGLARPPLLDIFTMADSFQASDPRDKIFALLGLAKETYRINRLPPRLRPDYTKSVLQVYSDFARGWICHTESLEILSLVDSTMLHMIYARISDNQFDMPSWMPFVTKAKTMASSIGSRSLYNAAAGRPPIVEPYTDARFLSLQGLRVDRVHSISKIMSESAMKSKSIGPKTLYQIWTCQLSQVRTKLSEPQTWHAFAQTVTSCGILNGSPLFDSIPWLPEYGQFFRLHFLPTFEADFAAYWFCADPKFESRQEKERSKLLALANKGNTDALDAVVIDTMMGNRFFTTDGGNMGISPPGTQVGDLICVIYGARVPHILRPVKFSGPPSPARYLFVGECYAHGCMDGEIMEKQLRFNMPSEVLTVC